MTDAKIQDSVCSYAKRHQTSLNYLHLETQNLPMNLSSCYGGDDFDARLVALDNLLFLSDLHNLHSVVVASLYVLESHHGALYLPGDHRDNREHRLYDGDVRSAGIVGLLVHVGLRSFHSDVYDGHEIPLVHRIDVLWRPVSDVWQGFVFQSLDRHDYTVRYFAPHLYLLVSLKVVSIVLVKQAFLCCQFLSVASTEALDELSFLVWW